MFLILTGLILTFFVTLLIITSIIHKNSLPTTHTKTITIPPFPLPRMLPSRVAAWLCLLLSADKIPLLPKSVSNPTWAGLLILPFCLKPFHLKANGSNISNTAQKACAIQSERYFLRQRQNHPPGRQIPVLARSRNRTLCLSAWKPRRQKNPCPPRLMLTMLNSAHTVCTKNTPLIQWSAL